MSELRVKATVSFQLSIELQESYAADKAFNEIYPHALEEAVRTVQSALSKTPEYNAKIAICGLPKISMLVTERK